MRAKNKLTTAGVIMTAAIFYGNGKMSRPSIIGLDVQPEGVALTWQASSLREQVVERTESLIVDPVDWTSIHSIVPSTIPSTHTFVDETPPDGASSLYYRVRELE